MRHWPIILFFIVTQAASADYLKDSVKRLETEWAHIRYAMPKAKQAGAYKPLLALADELVKRYPGDEEAIYWQAMLKVSLAEFENGAEALNKVHEVKDLLNKVIAINPRFMEGSAYVVLGALYYQVPGWPIAYGDKDEADRLLKKALEINPDGVDSNYFYGDFLLSQNRFEKAAEYFEKAIAARTALGQEMGDNVLKQKAKIALNNAKNHTNTHDAFSGLFGK